MADKLKPTPTQVLGPYFLADAPLRKNLDLRTQDPRGQELAIKGAVRSARTGRGIKGATVHVWLADHDGRYDNQDDSGGVVKLDPAQYRLRGCVTSLAGGAYAFTCHRPGNYTLDAAKTRWRPGHIHIRVSAPGYKTLVTQLYFDGDPHNEHDLPGEHFFKPELIVHLDPKEPVKGGVQKGNFDFVLEKA